MNLLAEPSLPSDLLEVDWDLLGLGVPSARNQPHWYPKLMRPEIAGVLIACLSLPHELVLDPFCGIGTTLVEAQRQGRRLMGGDVNPVASLTTTARTKQIEIEKWNSYVSALRATIVKRYLNNEFSTSSRDTMVPNFDFHRHWYHDTTLRELSVIWRTIRENRDKYDVIADAAFSAVLRSVSSHRGSTDRIADNLRPTRLVYRSAIDRFLERLGSYASAVQRRQGSDSDGGWHVDGAESIWSGSSSYYLGILPDNFTDLIVTRLPEFGSVDYIRSQRLSSFWFEWDIDTLANLEIGARFKRRRLEARQDYLDSMDNIIIEMVRVLKVEHWCALVLSPSHQNSGLADELCLLLQKRGLLVAGRLAVRRRRSGNRFAKEEIVIAQKRG